MTAPAAPLTPMTGRIGFGARDVVVEDGRVETVAPAPESGGPRTLGEVVRWAVVRAYCAAEEAAVEAVYAEARPAIRRQLDVGYRPGVIAWPEERRAAWVEAAAERQCAPAVKALRARWQAAQAQVLPQMVSRYVARIADALQVVRTGDDLFAVAADVRLAIPVSEVPAP